MEWNPVAPRPPRLPTAETAPLDALGPALWSCSVRLSERDTSGGRCGGAIDKPVAGYPPRLAWDPTEAEWLARAGKRCWCVIAGNEAIGKGCCGRLEADATGADTIGWWEAIGWEAIGWETIGWE